MRISFIIILLPCLSKNEIDIEYTEKNLSLVNKKRRTACEKFLEGYDSPGMKEILNDLENKKFLCKKTRITKRKLRALTADKK